MLLTLTVVAAVGMAEAASFPPPCAPGHVWNASNPLCAASSSCATKCMSSSCGCAAPCDKCVCCPACPLSGPLPDNTYCPICCVAPTPSPTTPAPSALADDKRWIACAASGGLKCPDHSGNLGTIFVLWYAGVTGPIPPADLAKMTGLTYIQFGFNALTGPIPKEIGLLTKLTVLDLAGNRFNGTIPRAIGLLTNLNTLCVHTSIYI